MNIFQLQDRLKQFPSSALAVRLASLYVARFRIDEVFKLCIESIKRYPKHSTSYLILGRGYAALRQYEAAVLCGEKALSLQPDSPLTKNLISNWQQIISTNGEKKRLEAFEILSAPTIDELQKLLKDDTVQPEPAITNFEPNYNIEPPKVETSTGETAQDELTNNELNRTLPEIVSVTLADIYTKQGEYLEAIKMYRALIIQRPKQKNFFEKNILILEEKLKFKS
ncbi:MAG: hypothetical protein QME58_01690 [Bacteroidota bacterium]|nr:hypothetical protein [Bacteroidota bacterium]